MSSGHTSLTSIHDSDEEGGSSITSNIRKLTEGKNDISTKDNISTPKKILHRCKGNHAVQLQCSPNAFDGEELNQN